MNSDTPSQATDRKGSEGVENLEVHPKVESANQISPLSSSKSEMSDKNTDNSVGERTK